MKKTIKKLALKREAIRALTGFSLDDECCSVTVCSIKRTGCPDPKPPE